LLLIDIGSKNIGAAAIITNLRAMTNMAMDGMRYNRPPPRSSWLGGKQLKAKSRSAIEHEKALEDDDEDQETDGS
jgi:hypothetical protein